LPDVLEALPPISNISRRRQKFPTLCAGCWKYHWVTTDTLRAYYAATGKDPSHYNARYYCPAAQRRQVRARRERVARQVAAKAARRAAGRAQLRCVTCRMPLTQAVRATARYCTPACSMKAYRARRRQAARRVRWQTSSTTMSDKMEYLSKIPSGVPDGRVVVHNTVRPTQRLGTRGFRAWFAEPSERLEVCGCNWAPTLGAHYRVKWEG
jgi:hypothetical protein